MEVESLSFVEVLFSLILLKIPLDKTSSTSHPLIDEVPSFEVEFFEYRSTNEILILKETTEVGCRSLMKFQRNLITLS